MTLKTRSYLPQKKKKEKMGGGGSCLLPRFCGWEDIKEEKGRLFHSAFLLHLSDHKHKRISKQGKNWREGKYGSGVDQLVSHKLSGDFFVAIST